jgi:ferrous iron transport protein B
MTKKITVALIGNPNCGKTTLYNRLTGLHQKTGNWTGVTVEGHTATVVIDDQPFEMVDLPGIYALSLEGEGEDERHVQQYLSQQRPDIILNIANADSLERSLFLTTELLEYGIPMIIVLNMVDEATRKGKRIDTKKLSELTGCPVVETVARSGKGLDSLKKNLRAMAEKPQPCPLPPVNYPQDILDQLPPVCATAACRADQINQLLANSPSDELEEALFSARFDHAHRLIQQVQKRKPGLHTGFSWLDRITTHPVSGLLIFFLAMYVMFFFAINVAGVFVDFFDQASHALLVSGGHQLLEAAHAPDWLIVLLADGLGGGIQTVATFVPIIGFLYLILTWLEDSGYMARAAFVMNHWMTKLGLSGKAFVPLIVGFGCNVPAIMATRGLPSRRERLLTIMMAPFMSCGARLSVYALFVAAFFADRAALIVFSLYLIGIAFAVFTGLMLRSTLLKGTPEPFIIELPPWRFPSFWNLVVGTWNRLKGFLLDAGKIIVVVVMVINILQAIGPDLKPTNNPGHSLLSATARSITPAFHPMGIEDDNWPAVVGILSGVLAKEVVVGTLDAIYGSLEQLENDNPDQPDVWQELQDAAHSVLVNGRDLASQITDPLGLSLITVSQSEVAEAQGVSEKLFGTLRKKFGSTTAAYAYLLFVLLYFPCVSASAAIAREAGARWAIFAGIWSTSLAWFTASAFYQSTLFGRQPLQSLLWLAAYAGFLAAVYVGLKIAAKREGQQDSSAEYAG